ncbi:MAG: acyl carrier protein, partial [Pseudomonadota bacterium]
MDREQRSSASRRSSGTNAETLVRATTRSHDADHGSTRSPVAEHTSMAIEDSVIAILTDLHHELHPGRHLAGSIAPDASLDSVFALDSLGRAEMIQRLERAFAVTLPDDLMVNAERLHDLVDA